MADTKPNMFDYRLGQIKKASERDYSDPRLYSRIAGASAGLFGDLLAWPVEKAVGIITPDVVKDAFNKGVNWVVNETDAGKAVIKLAKDNPEYAKDILDGLNIAGAIPVLKIFAKAGTKGIQKALQQSGGVKPRAKAGTEGAIGSSSFPRAVVRNMPTLQSGGMFGTGIDLYKNLRNRVKPYDSKTKASIRSLEEIASGTGKTSLTGANFYRYPKILSTGGEAIGALIPALRELTSAKALANLEAKGISQNAIKNELRNTDTPLAQTGSVTMQNQIHKQHGNPTPPLMKDNSPYMINARLGEFDLFDEKLIPEIKKVMFKGVPDEIATRHINHIKAVHPLDPNKPAILAVKPPKTNAVGREAVGAERGHHFIRSLTQGDLMEVYQKSYGVKEIDPRGMVELTQISMGMTKEVAKDMSKILGVKSSNQKKLINTLINARAKINTNSRVPLTKRETNVLNAWEKLESPVGTVKDASGKIVSNKNFWDIPEIKGDTLTTSGSYLSKSKELGGVNFILTHSLKRKRSYTTTSDGSDLFGIGGGPPNSPSLIVGIPTQEIIHGSKNTVTLKSGKELPMRVNKERLDQKRVNQKKQEQQGLKDLQKETGIPIKKGESPLAYHRRVLKAYKVRPKSRHYRQALANYNKILTASTQSDLSNNEGLFLQEAKKGSNIPYYNFFREGYREGRR